MPEIEDILQPLIDRPGTEPPPVEDLQARIRHRSSRRRAITTVGIVLALALPAAVLARPADGGEPVGTTGDASPISTTLDTTTTKPTHTPIPGLPTSFDPTTAPALPGAEGATPTNAANVYLEHQMGIGDVDDAQHYEVAREVSDVTVDETGSQARVAWRVEWTRTGAIGPGGEGTIDPGSAPHTGHLYLRDDGSDGSPRWVVVASTVDGVDLSDVVNQDHALSGTVASAADAIGLIDVTDLDGTPVPGSPTPRGHIGTLPALGTAGAVGGPEPEALDLDVALPADASPLVTVRLWHDNGVIVGVTQLIVDPTSEPRVADPTTSTPEAGETTSTTTAATTTSAPLDAPPWAGAPLRADQAPATVEGYSAPGAPGPSCPALAPADLGAGAGATARATDRASPGAWWIAYDLPGAPGEADIQTPSPNAGKETFSVSAITFPTDVDGVVDRFPNQLRWSDGSHGSYGLEGDGSLAPPAGMETAWLAYLAVGDSPCMYQVHSYLGRGHLEHLIDQLRFVEGSP